MIENIRARFAAKKFNVYTEKIDSERKPDAFMSGDWYANEYLWYGHPFGFFFKSSQNSWFQNKKNK